jgi:hypothetical protein
MVTCRTTVALALLGAVLPTHRLAKASPPPRVVVLAIDYNNLTNQPDDPAELPRLALLGAALRERLATACGYEVVPLDSAIEADAHLGVGYFYAHPDVASHLAASAGADWVVTSRLNRMGTWVADWQAHVIRVADTTVVADPAVSLRGFGMAPDLTARLAERGAASIADQVAEVIDRTAGARSPVPRRCPP